MSGAAEQMPEFAGARNSSALTLVLSLGLLVLVGCEPVGPMPGGSLEGDLAEVPDAWDAAREVALFQLETRPDDPYSVNLWGVVVDGNFYVASGSGAESNWVSMLGSDPAVRLRMGQHLYALRAVRVLEEEEMGAVRMRYIEKYEIEDDPAMDGEFGHEAWVFRLDPP